MTRTLIPCLAVTLVLLAGCSSAPATDAPATTSAPAETQAAAAPAATGPSGCDVVTPEMISAALGVDPGEPVEKPSNTAGGPTCHYDSIGADVQMSDQPDMYLADSVYNASQVEGAVAVPGADRGYVANGGFMIVKGDVGVFVTAFVSGTTLEQWQQLAAAALAKL